jgi:drug/metabolite transporter (DMT)-like permease
MLLVMAVIWGVNFPVMKYGLTVFEPLLYNTLRVTIACTVFAGIVYMRRARRPSPPQIRRLMLLGLLGHAAYQLLFINGLFRARAGTVALVIGCTPALIAILGRILGVERVSRWAAAGIATSIMGVVFVVIGASSGSSHDDSVFGIVLILLSSTCWAFYTMGLRNFTGVVDGVQIAAWTLFGGALPLFVAGIPALLRMDLTTAPLAAWGSVLYSGVMAFGVAYVLWYRGVERVGPTRTAMYANLQPLIALGAAWVTLHERPTPWQFAGGACVITGVYLSRK